MTMSKPVYIVVMKGVYMQGIRGAYNSEADAITCAHAAVLQESDDYHTMEVWEIPTGVYVPDADAKCIGTMARDDGGYYMPRSCTWHPEKHR